MIATSMTDITETPSPRRSSRKRAAPKEWPTPPSMKRGPPAWMKSRTWSAPVSNSKSESNSTAKSTKPRRSTRSSKVAPADEAEAEESTSMPRLRRASVANKESKVEVKSKVRDESERPGFEAEEASSSPSHEPDSAAKGSDTEAEAEFEVEHVLARSLKQYYLDGDDDEDYDDGDDDYMYLVRWKGFGPEEDTWEPASGLGNADGALSDYSRHLIPFTILDIQERKSGARFFVRHGIVSADIPPSPFYETQWTTENHLRKLYNGYVFARVMGEFRKGRRSNFSIAGQRNTVKKGTRKLMFLACWQEGDELFEEWLEPFDITKYFPKDAAAILSKYRRAGNVAKADTPEPENEYDKERLQKIKMNQKLLLDLGIGKL